MNYSCCDPRRRDVLQGSAFNGIDFLEVLDHDAPSDGERQRTLFVHFINPLVTPIGPTNVRIEGGDRIRDIGVINATVGAGNEAHVLTVDVDKPGDFSTYTLRIVQDQKHNDPPKGFDELFSAVEFSFKVECVSDFDCQPARSCPPDVTTTPEIDYLAKDYATFRRLMLDRMAALVPEWKERNAADLVIALVELLAYVGDKLSYEQDAIATEAYLGSARRRVSVRRHARLVDYFMHDGGNARVYVATPVFDPSRVLCCNPYRTCTTTGPGMPCRLTCPESSIAGLPSGYIVPLGSDEPPQAGRNVLAEEFLCEHPHLRGQSRSWGCLRLEQGVLLCLV
jgi:hypothetical protein